MYLSIVLRFWEKLCLQKPCLCKVLDIFHVYQGVLKQPQQRQPNEDSNRKDNHTFLIFVCISAITRQKYLAIALLVCQY